MARSYKTGEKPLHRGAVKEMQTSIKPQHGDERVAVAEKPILTDTMLEYRMWYHPRGGAKQVCVGVFRGDRGETQRGPATTTETRLSRHS